MRKSKEQIQVQVGAFLAMGILLFMTAVFMLGSRQNMFQSDYELICYFDDISGLRIGAPVQLAGINVGHIDGIDFVDRNLTPVSTDDSAVGAQSEEPKSIVKVEVSMKIDVAYADRIRTDSVASVVTQGLLGDRMIYITVGSNGHKQLKDGDELIDIRNPTGFTQLVEKGDALMIGATSFVDNTDQVAKNLNLILEEVIKGDGILHDVIYDQSSAESLNQVESILRNLDQMSRNLSHITGKINNGKGTLGALVNDDSLYQDVKTLMGKANRNRMIRSVINYTLKTKDKDQLK